MSDLVETTGGCGCCAGTDAETPRTIDNRPGLSTVVYRVGRHPDFKESLLARLSSADLPALAGLRTRADQDYTVALCDAFAVMADVITFYQERIANEAFVRTATERRSVLELARLIGYQLAPGVAAGTYLAFTLEDAPGARQQAARPVTVPVATRVQSVPGPDEQPQTFETVEDVEARWEWNAMGAQTREAAVLRFGDLELYLQGGDLNLKPGDVLLLVGRERLADRGSERWDVRILRTVEPDSELKVTRVTWDEPLGHVVPHVLPAAEGVQAFVLRLRASLFGHNAPDPKMFNKTGMAVGDLFTADQKNWKDFEIRSNRIDLDAAYPTVAPGSWLVLVTQGVSHLPSSFPGYKELYRAETVAFLSRTDYGLSGRITRVGPDTTEHLGFFGLRDTFVLAESERLSIAEPPVRHPVYGDTLALDRLAPDLKPGRPVAVSGKRLKIRLVDATPALQVTGTGGWTVPLVEGDVLTVLAAPLEIPPGGSPAAVPFDALLGMLSASPARVLRWRVRDRDGFVGTLQADGPRVVLEPPGKDDEVVSEIALIASRADAVRSDRNRTTLTFEGPLKNAYARLSVALNANVAAATHGETVREALGSGDASLRDQRFVLKQPPLTYVSAPTATGRASTLEVRVNDLAWSGVPTLYGRGPRDRVYTTLIEDDGRAIVLFGDGNEGARPPSGQENVRARYRRGLGAAGNVRAGQLTTVLSRPLGVKDARNPEPATGGEDPERLADARRNAPLSVLTLERAVSRRDYEDYARGFPGVGKAHALWVASGPGRGVFLTVAGPGGAAVPRTSATYKNLLATLRRFGDALLPLKVESYAPVTFALRGSVKVADDARADRVLSEVALKLRERFSFEAREFGQPVTIDEVIATAHEVAGVVAVDVDELYRKDPGATPTLDERLPVALPTVGANGVITPAELLTLDPGPLPLAVMA